MVSPLYSLTTEVLRPPPLLTSSKLARYTHTSAQPEYTTGADDGTADQIESAVTYERATRRVEARLPSIGGRDVFLYPYCLRSHRIPIRNSTLAARLPMEGKSNG